MKKNLKYFKKFFEKLLKATILNPNLSQVKSILTETELGFLTKEKGFWLTKKNPKKIYI